MAAPCAGWSGSAAFAGGVAIGFAALMAASWWLPPIDARAQQQGPSPAALKASFARPAFVPHPADNPPSAARIELGARLFEDKRLSTGSHSCASCHDPKLAFSDGEPRGKGVTGKRLVRHTPSLWNLAWAPLLFWDGRATSLEDQPRFPVSHPDEMGSSIEDAAVRLARDGNMARAFALAFPEDPRVTPANLVKALAAFERTLVSPPTRFDRWAAGEAAALTPQEQAGFALFTGKGRCVNCHTGFAFTDGNFYDIGLPGADKGRGPIANLAAADHAFKTPTLRELAWTAPYMHDGSLATLEDVVRHYERGGTRRATRSRDLPQGLALSTGERRALVAFLESLSSEAPPAPSTEAWVGAAAPPPRLPPAADATVVSQASKRFAPAHVRLKAGQSLTVLNDDTRTHNVRIFDPRLDFNSGAQEPHESVTIRFPLPGTFEAFCSIHPSMRLTVDVR